MDTTQLLNKLLDKQDLETSETKLFLESVMKGEVLPTQIAAILVALRMKGETTEEIVGFVQAMREQMIRVDIKDAIDVCGTGGDGSRSFNISTTAAFVIAGCGVSVAKHGNRAASSKCGSADVLEALGVTIQLTAQQAKKVLENVGMVFLFAPNFHPATKYVATVRKELKIRTVFNLLGPFLNPASVTKQLMGVANIDSGEKLIHVGKQLGYEHLLIVTSEDGMDEISLAAKTHIFELKNKIIKKFILDPNKYGFKKALKKEITEGSLEENAQYVRDVLSGIKNAKRDIVILNSAVALYTADKAKDIQEGIKMAEEAIDNGTAKQVLENLIKETKKYA